MRRREIVAGIASAGVLGGAGAVLWRGRPFSGGGAENGTETTDSIDGSDDGPIEVETLDAPGSEAGTLAVPGDGVTLLMFFSPVCQRCQSLLPNFAEAQERLEADHGDAVTVASVTEQQSPEQLREWWDDHDGDWTLAYDPDRDLATRYDVVSHPELLVIDADGAVRWHEDGVLEAEPIVDEVERVLEADESASEDADADSSENG